MNVRQSISTSCGDPVIAFQRLQQPLRDRHLVVGGTRLPFLVDGQRDDGSAVLLSESCDPREAGVRCLAVLEVHRVQRTPPAEHVQPGLQYGGLGRVEHDRQRRCGGESAGDLLHVGDTIAADIVDTQVEQVRAVPDLRSCDLDAALPVLGQHRLAKRLRPVRVRPLPDREVRRVLPERDVLVQARHARLGLRFAVSHRAATDSLDHLTQVLGRRTAAAADQGQAVAVDEGFVRVGQLLGSQRVEGAVGGQLREAGVRHAGERDGRVLGEVAQVLAHLLRAGCAVQPDQVDAEWFECRQGRADLGAEQHRPGGLDRHRDDHRDGRAGGFERLAGADHAGLGLQQVLGGLDQDRVRSPVDQSACGFGVRVPQGRERGVTEGRELGAGADAAEHEARVVGRRRSLGRLAGQPGAGLAQLVDPVGNAVLPQVGEVGSEGVRLDAVDSDVEVRLVDLADHIRTGQVEDLVAALVPLELVQRQVVGLQHRAHRPVGHHHAFGQHTAQIGSAGSGHGTSSDRGWTPISHRSRAERPGHDTFRWP